MRSVRPARCVATRRRRFRPVVAGGGGVEDSSAPDGRGLTTPGHQRESLRAAISAAGSHRTAGIASSATSPVVADHEVPPEAAEPAQPLPTCTSAVRTHPALARESRRSIERARGLAPPRTLGPAGVGFVSGSCSQAPGRDRIVQTRVQTPTAKISRFAACFEASTAHRKTPETASFAPNG